MTQMLWEGPHRASPGQWDCPSLSQAATPQQAQRGPWTDVGNHGNVPKLTVGIIVPVNIYCSYIPIYLFGYCLIRERGNPCSFPGHSWATIQPPVVQWPHTSQLSTSPQAWTDCPSSVTHWFLTRAASATTYETLLKLMLWSQSKPIKAESLWVGHKQYYVVIAPQMISTYANTLCNKSLIS